MSAQHNQNSVQENQQKQDTSTNTADSTPKSADPKIQQILDKHATVFQGEGKLRGQEMKLHIRTDVEPIIQPQHRIPYHMRKRVAKELQRLVKGDIIEPVSDQPTPWISPMVCTPKKDGSTHICPDMREANTAIQRERHLMPTLNDFKAEVNGSKFFSKIGLKMAYQQLPLAAESRYITTFTTHEGLFRFKRLNYGTNSTAEIFQNVLQRNLSDISGVKNIADDIIIHGKSRQDHDKALDNCLKRLEDLNLKAKGRNVAFYKRKSSSMD